MPMPNFHAFRVKSAKRFKRMGTKQVTKGISIITGPLKKPPMKKNGKGRVTGAVVQSYRFDRLVFSFAEAKVWMRSHKIKYILAEKAEPKVEDIIRDLGDMLLEKLRAS